MTSFQQMSLSGSAVLLLAVSISLASSSSVTRHRKFCVVGAGPAGLQLGAFFQDGGEDYVVLERAEQAGSFFELYPRHDMLISINKRYTGLTNTEFNLRHDWNSLLTSNPELKFARYSKEFFPHRKDLLKYLRDFQQKLHIKVEFNTSVLNLRKSGELFLLDDQNGRTRSCSVVILATGLPVPNIPTEFIGSELAIGYEEAPLERSFYEGKTVAILGKGNSAFETALHIHGHTNRVHLMSRNRVRLAWQTHYIGDLRAVNTGILDTYQLKSLDGINEVHAEFLRLYPGRGGKISMSRHRSYKGRRPLYDVVIRCLGWNFDFGIFNSSLLEMEQRRPFWKRENDGHHKYPPIDSTFQVQDIPGLYVAGAASHSLDYRKSAGGFIHGFRYTARALYRFLTWHYEKRPWINQWFPVSTLLDRLIRRINEASGIYQMYSFLGDVAILSRDGESFAYLEEFPVATLARVEMTTGVRSEGGVVVLLFEYGRDFSYPGADTLRSGRSTRAPQKAFKSNFLHPVFYFYRKVPSEQEMAAKEEDQILPQPDRLHHTVEDFETFFRERDRHTLPLQRFLEHSLNQSLDIRSAESCLALALTSHNLPITCRDSQLVVSKWLQINSW